MGREDSVNLLKECSSGIQMAVESIDEVLPYVKDDRFKGLLQDSKHEHQKLGDETHQLLHDLDDESKEPNPMAKGMSWIKTNVKLSVNPTDNTAADLITDGCNMGVKSLSEYMNRYKTADDSSKQIAEKLVRTEEQLSQDIRQYL